MKTIIRRAMDLGFYEGVNLALDFCDSCGHKQIDMGDICPVCGSDDLTKISRMNGYLLYTRIKGKSRTSKAKLAEINKNSNFFCILLVINTILCKQTRVTRRQSGNFKEEFHQFRNNSVLEM